MDREAAGDQGEEMLKSLAAALSCGVCVVAVATPAQAQTREYRIPAGSLKSALDAYARQSGRQVIYKVDEVRRARTPGASGNISAEAALYAILSGTGFTARRDSSGAVAIVQTNIAGSPSAGEAEARSAAAETESADAEEIVVTGSRIRGAQPSSPVLTITDDDARLAGHTNLGQVIRAVPQNFNGGQNPEVGFDASSGSLANSNSTGSSTFNLRGLGPDATLTLLNGQRLSYDGFVQGIDVSAIPVAAIQRIEILLDGASAIYGSDAVAGVTNIILKRDYQGVELSARYGAATEGGAEQQQYTGLAGHTWGSGGFMVTGDYSRNTAVRAGQRDYLDYIPDPESMIYPAFRQKSGLFSGHQELGGFVTISLDAFYTKRESERLALVFDQRNDEELDSTIWGIHPGMRFDLPSDWSLGITGAVGRNKSVSDTVIFSRTTGNLLRSFVRGYFNKVEAVGLEAEGPAFALPGGSARLSIGGGYRKNSFREVNLVTGVARTEGADRSRYVYGEVYLPLISEGAGIPLVSRLSVNGAVRHEDYRSFGSTTTPKLGAILGINRDIEAKVSWGRSFKVPTLSQQFSQRSVFLFPGFFFPGASPGSNILAVFGGEPDLSPEKAETLTAGLVASPNFLPGLRAEFNWFDVDYIDRITLPIEPFGAALINPAFAEFVTLSPTEQQQNAIIAAANTFVGGPFNPSTIFAIVNNSFTNAVAQNVSGVDLTLDYTTDLAGGSLNLTGNGNWITNATRKLTSLSPETAAAGVIFFPPKFRGRTGVSWSRNGLTLGSHLNHIAGVRNTRITSRPKGDSMTTVDLVIDYQGNLGPIDDVGLNLAVTNLFNERPPFLQPANLVSLNYDSTNYSALGRVISFTLTKRF